MIRVVLQRETPLERGRRAMKYVKKRSVWLGKRPLTDGNDEDSNTRIQGC
jgi:hypothetical protein